MYEIIFISDTKVHSIEQISELLFERIGNVYEFEKIKQKYIDHPGLILVVLRNGDNMMSCMINHQHDDDTDGLTEYMKDYIKYEHPEHISNVDQIVRLVESCFIIYAKDSKDGMIDTHSVNESIEQVIKILNDINNHHLVKDKVVVNINNNTLN